MIALAMACATTYWHNFLFNETDATRFQIILTASVLRTTLASIGAWVIYSGWRGIRKYSAFVCIGGGKEPGN